MTPATPIFISSVYVKEIRNGIAVVGVITRKVVKRLDRKNIVIVKDLTR